MANKGGEAPRDQEEEEEEEKGNVTETTTKETTTPSKPGRTTWELATGEGKRTTAAVLDIGETRAKSQSNVTSTRADTSTSIQTASKAAIAENTTTAMTTTSTLELLDEVLDNREEEHRGADPGVAEVGTSTLSTATTTTTTTTTLELLDEVLKAENARRYLTRGSGEHEVLESAGQFHRKGSGNHEEKRRRSKKKKPANNESLRDEGNSHSKVAGSGEISRFKKRLRRKKKKKSRLRHESRKKAEDKQNWPDRVANYNLERRTKEISRN